jgi:hypothetical protein
MTAKFLLMLLLMSLHLPAVSWVGRHEEGYIAFQKGDYATALQKWRPLAEEGSADAQLSVGAMYDKAQGVPQDYAEAAKWYRKAADQGEAQAQHNLGKMYQAGRGVTQDYAERECCLQAVIGIFEAANLAMYEKDRGAARRGGCQAGAESDERKRRRNTISSSYEMVRCGAGSR